MSEFPATWTSTTLDRLLTSIESGSRPRGGVRGIAEGVPSIGGEHLTYDGGFDFTSIKYVPTDFAGAMRRGHIQKGDVLIVKDGATTGKTSYISESFPFENAVVNEHVFACRFHEGFEPRFIFRYLTSWEGQQRILANFQGAAQGGINLTFAPNTEVPVAPFNEQKRIVEKLEKLLGKVEAAQERLDKIPVILKRFRQSVLAAACSGKLTADWRGGITASEELPTSWDDVVIDDVLESSFYGSRFAKEEYRDEGIPTIRTSDMDGFGHIVFDNPPRVPLSQERFESIGLKHGDLVITRTGATIGKCAVYDESLGPALPSAYLIRFRFDLTKISSKYVFLYLQSPNGQNLLIGGSTAVAQPNVNAETIKQFPLALPPLEEQKEIVRRVEELFKFADQIEERYKKARSYTDKLPQSILAKAFRGELVPQDPNDEPASVLLDKIRAKKVLPDGQPKPEKTKMNKKTNKKRKSDALIDVAEALRLAGGELSGKELLIATGYSADAEAEEVEKFFVTVRDALSVNQIAKIRRGDEDWFSLVKTQAE